MRTTTKNLADLDIIRLCHFATGSTIVLDALGDVTINRHGPDIYVEFNKPAEWGWSSILINRYGEPVVYDAECRMISHVILNDYYDYLKAIGFISL